MPTGIYKRKFKTTIKAGDKFGRLAAVKFSHRNKWCGQHWMFICDCGNKKEISLSDVERGHTKSCGCLNSETLKKRMTKHGMTKTKIYKTWMGMKIRCYNKNSSNYKNYGGRGLAVYPEWLCENGFENFYNDMGEIPKGKSLDRIDNDKGYCKSNCKWSTPTEQANNTRKNHFLTYNNITLTISQWEKRLSTKPFTIHRRIRRGWTIERALTFNI